MCPAAPLPRPAPRRRPAFTLIELLVVIGIIAVLISILIPTVGRMRLTGQNTSSQSQMQRIAAAITNYYHDFQAYPGALANSVFATQQTATYMGDANYTQSEDCTVALLGGMSLSGSLTANPVKMVYNSTFVGSGPITYNPTNPGKKSAYLERTPSDLPVNFTQKLGTEANGLQNSFTTDSQVIEFMDQFSDPRPVLYIRANPAAKTGGGFAIYNSATSGSFNKDCSYDIGTIQKYLNSSSTSGPEDFRDKAAAWNSGWSGTNLNPADARLLKFFQNDAQTGAKFAGTFILIGAGIDRRFGTEDDIIMGGGGGQ